MIHDLPTLTNGGMIPLLLCATSIGWAIWSAARSARRGDTEETR